MLRRFLQVGQAGCQGGAALFQLLAEEAAPSAQHWDEAADRFFYLADVRGKTRLTARAVLLDMEPKVVAAAQRAGSGAWYYSQVAALTRQSGSGNNWAHGALHHAPSVRHQVLGMLRRQVERCDTFGGFLVMQSMAGGTGSGLGSAVTSALREEYGSCRILNHCIWPYDSGEVVVQPYNSMLTLSSLAHDSSGILLSHNEALSATCQQQLGIQRPGFADLNALAARCLASVLLPASLQQAPDITAAAPAALGRGAGSNSGFGRGRAGGGLRGRPAWDSSSRSGGAGDAPEPQAAASPAAWDGTFGSGSRWDEEDEPAANSRYSNRQGGAGSRLDPLADVCDRLCSQAGYPLLTLRCAPHVPASSLDFTPFSWPTLLRDLKQLQSSGRPADVSGLSIAGSWAGSSSSSLGTGSLGGGSRAGTQGPQRYGAGSSSGRLGGIGGGSSSSGRASNKALASLVVLRGDQATAADVSCFGDAALYSGQQQQATPLAVAASSTRLAGQQMFGALLSNDQTPVAPVGRMLGKACQLYEARAFVHQLERYGLEATELALALGEVEELVGRYSRL